MVKAAGYERETGNYLILTFFHWWSKTRQFLVLPQLWILYTHTHTHTRKTSNKINININCCFHLSICLPSIHSVNIYYVPSMRESTSQMHQLKNNCKSWNMSSCNWNEAIMRNLEFIYRINQFKLKKQIAVKFSKLRVVCLFSKEPC